MPRMPDDPPAGGFRPERGWVEVMRCGSLLEAEIGRAVLEAAGYDAMAASDDAVGIFGPNFMGRTQRGARVLVPAEQAAAARIHLANRETG